MTVAPPRSRQELPPTETAGWIRRLSAAAWEHRVLVVLSLLAAAFGVGVQAVTPLLVRTAVDDAVAGQTGGLPGIAVFLVVLQLIAFGTAFARRYLGGTTPQRTADTFLAAPTPMMQPVIVCVVDTGMPSSVAANSMIEPPVSAQKPCIGVSRVIFEPIVCTMRQPPTSVPSRHRGLAREHDPERHVELPRRDSPASRAAPR